MFHVIYDTIADHWWVRILILLIVWASLLALASHSG